MSNNQNTRLVYSTGSGDHRPDDRRSRSRKPEGKADSTPPADGIVRVSRETKGRKGKGMTIVTGVPLSGGALKDLARELKQQCGTGGTVKGGVIEIQGDHRDKLVDALSARGWTVKKAGG